MGLVSVIQVFSVHRRRHPNLIKREANTIAENKNGWGKNKKKKISRPLVWVNSFFANIRSAENSCLTNISLRVSFL